MALLPERPAPVSVLVPAAGAGSVGNTRNMLLFPARVPGRSIRPAVGAQPYHETDQRSGPGTCEVTPRRRGTDSGVRGPMRQFRLSRRRGTERRETPVHGRLVDGFHEHVDVARR